MGEIDLKEYMEVILEHYKIAHNKEHLMLDKALERADETLNLRLESMNEFRTQINSERGSFVTLDRFLMKIEEIERMIKEKYERNEKRIGILEVAFSNIKGRFTAIAASISIGLIIIELILRFFVK